MKGKNQLFHYYVEGENEKKLIGVLKTKMGLVRSGKITVLNVALKKITKRQLMELRPNTIVVFVFDTDTGYSRVLQENIEMMTRMKRQKVIKDYICITQVDNLEDELERSCDISDVLEITKSSSISEHKKAFNKMKDIDSKLKEISFDIDLFWSTSPGSEFAGIENGGWKVKI